MKKIAISFVICLLAWTAHAQEYRIDKYTEQQGRDSVRAFFIRFAYDIQQLGTNPDSAHIQPMQANVLKHYFINNQLLVPNVLEEDEAYRQKRPLITAKKWIDALPTSFLQGYQYVIEDSLIKIIAVKHPSKTETEVTCLVPLKFWGIKKNQGKLHRIGEYLVFQLRSSTVDNTKNFNFSIKEIGYTGKWIFGEPLTQKIAESIENKVVSWINTLFDKQKSDAEIAMACQELRNSMKGDTIFFYKSDKVLRAFSINECSKIRTDSVWRNKPLKVLTSFDLSYTTDFYLEPNGQYLGERSQLEKVTLHNSNTTPWYASKKVDLVVVPTHITKNQLSYWQLSNVVIQPLMIQK